MGKASFLSLSHEATRGRSPTDISKPTDVVNIEYPMSNIEATVSTFYLRQSSLDIGPSKSPWPDPAAMPAPDADAALHALERENERLRRAVNELSILNELATAIGVARDFDEVIHTIVQRSLRAVGAEQGVVTLVNEAPTR